MARLNLTGKTFGKLYVEGLAYIKDQHTFWNCICACGKKCIKKGKYLTNGDTKSCGCLIPEQSSINGKNNVKRNRFEIENNYVKVFFHNTDNYFLCDLDDLPFIEYFTWHESEYGYARGDVGGKLQMFHDTVIGLIPDDNHMCDHINRNRLDNRKDNLRVVSRNINAQNRSVRKDNKYGVSGIYEKEGIYYACIQKDGVMYDLGAYRNIESAKNARLKAEKDLLAGIKYEYMNQEATA